MSAPRYPPQWNTPLGWDGDPPASSVSLVTLDICASNPLPDPPSPYSDTYTPASGTSPASQPSSRDDSWSLRVEDSFSGDSEPFWSPWIDVDYAGVADGTTSSPVDMASCGDPAHTFGAPPESPSKPEVTSPQATVTPLTTCASYTSVWCSPPPLVSDIQAQSYSIPFPIIQNQTHSYPSVYHDVQLPFGGSPRYTSAPAAMTSPHSPPWTSRAIPRSSRCNRDVSAQSRNAQISFVTSPARPRHSFAGPLAPCPSLPARSLLFHASRRAFSSVFPTPSPQKRKRDIVCDADDGKQAPPMRSELRPPKQAPSVWQIYFTDWLEQKKSQGDKKLNVAQAAKEAAQQYNKLSDEEREELKQRALVLKDKYERECAAWKRRLTPEDVARENAYRTAQRRSGKSRRKNINDPNAPKRPLSAYFLFLQDIRGDPALAKEVFGAETETTRQSVLAAAKWRSMSEAEKQPYFEKAENAKLQYEADRRVYEDQTRQNSSMASLVFYSPSSSSLHEGRGEDDGILSTPGNTDY